MYLTQNIINMKKIFLLLTIGAVVITGCTKILETKPESSLDAATGFTTKESIDAGILGIYNSFQGASYYGTSYTLFPDLEADNLDHTGSFPTYQEIKNREINPDNVDVTNVWNQIYAGIDRANNIIAASENIKDAAFEKNKAIAEAKFLRAYLYFDLIRFFGGDATGYALETGVGVPLVVKPTYTISDAAPVAKSTAKQVFDQINTDLDFAIANLSDPLGTGRAGKNAAVATKARVSLYLNKFEDAETLSSQIIDQFSGTTAYGGLTENYADIFIKKNQQPESIFELQFSSTNSNGLFFYYFGRDEVESTKSLKNAHEAGDLRLPVNYYTVGSITGTLKYGRADGTDNVLLIRLAELYLIRAEARARKASPDIDGAAADLNIVRARAGLGNTSAESATDIANAVIKERRVEFAHEAQRWFDLRRIGLAATAFGIADARKVLWPIPQNEVLTSGNVIQQNPGY